MIFTIWLLMLSGPRNSWSAECPVEDPAKDYIMQFHKPAKQALTHADVGLSEEKNGFPAQFTLTDMEACGSMGCEYGVYEKLAPKCYRRLALLRGHLEVLESKSEGYRDIHVLFKPDYLSKSERTYRFDPKAGKYTERKSN